MPMSPDPQTAMEAECFPRVGWSYEPNSIGLHKESYDPTYGNAVGVIAVFECQRCSALVLDWRKHAKDHEASCRT